MGCDVHMHVEVKVSGKWLHYSCPRIQRSYDLFGILAGVRGEGPPIVDPKGLPDDLSEITRIDYEYEKEDSHTESWLNKKELAVLVDKMGWEFEHEQLGYANGNPFSSIGDQECGHPKEYEDARAVIWFDN